MNSRLVAYRWVLSLALALPAVVFAHAPSPQECAEGGEFIRNAALGRDHGLTRDAYMARLQSDLILIRNFPPALRWFVQDDEDEALLVRSASAVFDAPRLPGEHEAEFRRSCALQASNL